MTIVDKQFSAERVEVDGFTFERCIFDRCRIVYSAAGPVQFKDCKFISCDWVFNDAADLTLAYLAALYRGLGDEGRTLVDSIFQEIRTGTLERHAVEPLAAATA
jgi:hypothetical protein